jgi:hypothetical protein
MNNVYKIKLEAPLLRHGLTIETTCSEKYVVPVTKLVMDLAREINSTKEGKKK